MLPPSQVVKRKAENQVEDQRGKKHKNEIDLSQWTGNKNRTGSMSIEDLPLELGVLILRFLYKCQPLTVSSFLDPSVLCVVSLVNKKFNTLTNDNSLWKHFCQKRFHTEKPADVTSWKESYKIFLRTRCVTCGSKAHKAKNYAARLLGVVLCQKCKALTDYSKQVLCVN
jgi:hypothetical protein